MNSRLCVVQMHYTDLFPGIYENNAVSKLLESDVVDRVVIVAADLEKNHCLNDIATKWGCDICFGATENVAERIDRVATEYGASALLRVLPQWYFIDLSLIREMFELLESEAGDYISLPRDFDIRFGGDVFSKKFIETLNRELSGSDKGQKQIQFNPWGYVDANGHSSLKTIDLDQVSEYSNSDFEQFRECYNAVWPEQWDTADSPQAPYQLADRYIQADSTILDIACGHGAGSKYLLDQGAKAVVGVNISKNIIKRCQLKYAADDQLTFVHGDALNINFEPCSFDLIMTIHTMEHVIDDEQFLARLKSWLKPDGVVILEVPLLMRLPFKDSKQPYGDAHIREYYPDSLINLFGRYFKIIRTYGVSRGFYVEKEKARNAMLLIGENN